MHDNTKIKSNPNFSSKQSEIFLIIKKPFLSLRVQARTVKRAFHSNLPVIIENSSEISKVEPKIFIKKTNIDKNKTIPLKTPDYLGYIRHYPPATAEWSSSIYAHYNNNHIKSIPILDKNLLKLIKSYFSFYHKSELYVKSDDEPLDISNRLPKRFKRASFKRIFINKAELKHTNSKLIINIDLFNLQIRHLIQDIKLSRDNYLLKEDKYLKESDIKVNKVINELRHYLLILIDNILRKFLSIKELGIEKKKLILKKKKLIFKKRSILKKTWYIDKCIAYEEKVRENLKMLNKLFKWVNKIKLSSEINSKNKEINQIKSAIVYKIRSTRRNIVLSRDRKLKMVGKLLKTIMVFKLDNNIKILDKVKELKEVMRFREIEVLRLRRMKDKINKYYTSLHKYYFFHKFEIYLNRFIKLIGKIYANSKEKEKNYKVEINMVFLKHMYLNSDILSQAIALKLRNRDNRVWRVLTSCLNMVQLPYAKNKFKERGKAGRAESFIDKIKNINLDSFAFANKVRPVKPYSLLGTKPCSFAKSKAGYDSLNGLILGALPIMPKLNIKKLNIKSWYFFLDNFLKYKTISGIRLEAKGRLTRRFKASRSIFKLRWIGGLKNIDSSYKGLSASILRGHVKSNVQYTLTHSKNRIGAYGVKGWVSGK
jgi:hypothetical protein